MAKKTTKDVSQLFQRVLGNEAGREVIEELNIFCNGTRSHNAADSFELARLEGRREVLMHIMTLLKYKSIEEVFDDFVEDF